MVSDAEVLKVLGEFGVLVWVVWRGAQAVERIAQAAERIAQAADRWGEGATKR